MTTEQATPKEEPKVQGPRTEEQIHAEMKRAASSNQFDALSNLAKELDALNKAKAQAKAALLAEERSKRHGSLERKLQSSYAGDIDMIREFGPIAYLTIDCSESEPVYSAVLGTAATPSHRRPKGNGASRMTGKVAETYGRPLDSVFQEFATPEEQAACDAAANPPADWDPTKRWRGDSIQYNIKRKVLTRAIEEGKLTPIA